MSGKMNWRKLRLNSEAKLPNIEAEGEKNQSHPKADVSGSLEALPELSKLFPILKFQ